MERVWLRRLYLWWDLQLFSTLVLYPVPEWPFLSLILSIQYNWPQEPSPWKRPRWLSPPKGERFSIFGLWHPRIISVIATPLSGLSEPLRAGIQTYLFPHTKINITSTSERQVNPWPCFILLAMLRRSLQLDPIHALAFIILPARNSILYTAKGRSQLVELSLPSDGRFDTFFLSQC